MSSSTADDRFEAILRLAMHGRSPKSPFEFELARYEILDRLGEGGMGEVHRARDRQLDRMVAIKIVRPAMALHETLRQRFHREVEILAQLQHPHIVKIHDAGEKDGRLYLVMELVEGKSLRQVLAGPQEPLTSRLRLLEKAARGVAAAHEKGVVHRDISPANILVRADGEPKVTDFGLARVVDSASSVTRTGTPVGTPPYMAPEQVRGTGDEMTPRTDVYALGAILYEMLTGRPPHTGRDAVETYQKIVSEEPAAPRRLNRQAGRLLEAICLKAIDKDPGRRYPDAGAFANDLQRYAAGESVSARSPSRVARTVRRVIQRPVLSGVAAGATLIGLAMALLAVGVIRSQWAREAAIVRARPHLQAGRAILLRVDRLMTAEEEADPAAARSLVEQARAEFHRALAEFPSHPEAFLEIASTYRILGDNEKALEHLSRAIEADPQFAPPFLERALILLGRYEELRHGLSGVIGEEDSETLRLRAQVKRDLDEVRRLSSDPEALPFPEGVLAFAEGRYEEAARLLEGYAEEKVSDPRSWHWAGHAWYHVRDRSASALRALDRVLQFRPRDVETLVLRGVTRLDRGDLDGAIADFDRAIQIYPRHAPAYVNRGIARLHRGDPEGAVEDQTAALGIQPDLAQAYNNRSRARLALEDVDGAIADCAEALRLNPRYTLALYNRGMAYQKAGRWDEAMGDFDAAIRCDPNNADFYLDRGRLLGRWGRAGEALRDFEEVIRREEGRCGGYVERGVLRLTQGDLVGAGEDFEKALELHPDCQSAYRNRGVLRRKTGDLDGAISDCSEAIRLVPTDADSHHNRANALWNKAALLSREGRRREGGELCERALADYGEAIRLQPKHYEAFFARGQLRLAVLREYESAITDLERALALAPGDWSKRTEAEKVLTDAKTKAGH